MNTANDYLVGVRGDRIVFLRPPVGVIPKDEALRIAAWIVALVDPEHGRFQEVLDAVEAI